MAQNGRLGGKLGDRGADGSETDTTPRAPGSGRRKRHYENDTLAHRAPHSSTGEARHDRARIGLARRLQRAL